MMQDHRISVMKIVHSTSVDGVGLRNSLYVAGCPLQCPGCHNRVSWDINSGTMKTVEEVCQDLNIDDFNISILGGEPLFQYSVILDLCKLIKQKYPSKTIWMWSGYTFEQISNHYNEILNYIDVLIDGKFVEELKATDLLWRGSLNQRLINVKSTL